MIRSVFDWVLGRSTPQHPPQRLGCVDVDIFATPRSEEQVSFLQRVEALRRHQEEGRPLSRGLVDYFADRFHRLDIPTIVGCPFDVYLKKPVIVESIRHDLADSSHSD